MIPVLAAGVAGTCLGLVIAEFRHRGAPATVALSTYHGVFVSMLVWAKRARDAELRAAAAEERADALAMGLGDVA